MDAKQMIVEGQAIQLKDEAARNAIADEYDSTSTYSVGDYCIYGGMYYRCTTAVTTAESFDSTKWTATQVGDELSNKANMINIYNVPASAISLTSGSYGGFSYQAAVDISNIVPQSGETVIAIIPRGGGTTNPVLCKLGGTGQNLLYIFTATSSKPNVDIVTIKNI